MPRVLIKRGTRAQIASAATAGQLTAGECYLMTDESRVSVATASNAFADTAMLGEGQVTPWINVSASQRRVAGAAAAVSMSVSTLIASRLYFIPFCAPRRVTLTQLGVRLLMSTTGTIWLGIYSNAITGVYDRPRSLLQQISSAINTDVPGERIVSLASSLTLDPGATYWAALIASVSPNIMIVPVGGMSTALGHSSGGVSPITHLFGTDTTNTLPATAPAELTLGIGNAPAIFLI